ncbi:unnamed protein product, partial [Didymodactylos carnosus]
MSSESRFLDVDARPRNVCNLPDDCHSLPPMPK